MCILLHAYVCLVVDVALCVSSFFACRALCGVVVDVLHVIVLCCLSLDFVVVVDCCGLLVFVAFMLLSCCVRLCHALCFHSCVVFVVCLVC